MNYEQKLEDLELDRKIEIAKQWPLTRKIANLGKELKNLAIAVKTSKVVTVVSGAVSALSLFCVAGASDFEEEARTGIDAFTLPEVQAALAVMGITAAVAGVAGWIYSKLSNKQEDKEFEQIDLERQLTNSEIQVQAIDAEKQRVENQQQFNKEFQETYGEVSADMKYATDSEKYQATFDRIAQKEIAKIDSMVEVLSGPESPIVDDFEQV